MDKVDRPEVPKENMIAVKVWFGAAILAVILMVMHIKPAFWLLILSVPSLVWAGWPIRKWIFFSKH